jgi:hypothetical protein
LTTKFQNFGNFEKETYKFYEDQEMINSIKENMIHRIAFREWKFVEYYLSEVLNYCKLSEMLDDHSANQLKISRIEQFN